LWRCFPPELWPVAFVIKAERVGKHITDPRSETVRFSGYASYVKRSASWLWVTTPSALRNQICTTSLGWPNGTGIGCRFQKLEDLKRAYPAFAFFKHCPTPFVATLGAIWRAQLASAREGIFLVKRFLWLALFKPKGSYRNIHAPTRTVNIIVPARMSLLSKISPDAS
jgi:hypothetical protein